MITALTLFGDSIDLDSRRSAAMDGHAALDSLTIAVPASKVIEYVDLLRFFDFVEYHKHRYFVC